MSIAKLMFRQAWSQRWGQLKACACPIERELIHVDNKIAKLERQKLVLSEKLAKSGKPKHGFDEVFELTLQILSNPWKLWISGQLHYAKQ
ncbi:MAG: hypothetical protein ABJM29_11305 [Rhizobiaceae bacterium]